MSAPRSACAVGLVLAVATNAHAHDPDDPDAHRSMPNQVTAGVTVVCPGWYQLSSEPAETAHGATCIGASIAFAREVTRAFEVRVRAAYERPFFIAQEEPPSLHVWRATVAAALSAYRLGDVLTITVGPEVGVAGFAVDDRSPAWGLAFGWVVGVRPWVTYHAGLFAELGYGRAIAWSDEATVESSTLGRVTLGWADRF
ncbi:MAG: hypothetical protein IPM79_38830 [Polyangiaceae bacterium]|nr:hypothetical protein [Polyangiaceae bacterium]MBK8943403.1 hypothetical protein [Polyangiaceae bacterium]